jgi:hypothetical protein
LIWLELQHLSEVDPYQEHAEKIEYIREIQLTPETSYGEKSLWLEYFTIPKITLKGILV